MKRRDIVRRFARQSGVSRAQAADRLDCMVHQILADLRQGRKTALPGLGTLCQNEHGRAFLRRDGAGDGVGDGPAQN
jgi:nucleoid DNA-binding protein